MMKCPEEYGKQWKLEQEKSEWQKQKKEEAKEKAERKQEEREIKGRKIVEVKRVAKEWEIWDKEEEAARLEEKVRKLMPEKFHQWIKVFGKKQSERILIRKVWDHAIEMKEGFMPRKGKVYPLSREEREEVREFIKEQLRKGYIQLFVGKKDGKKRMVQDYRYLNE